jgi:uncharacterized membrane protein
MRGVHPSPRLVMHDGDFTGSNCEYLHIEFISEGNSPFWTASAVRLRSYLAKRGDPQTQKVAVASTECFLLH